MSPEPDRYYVEQEVNVDYYKPEAYNDEPAKNSKETGEEDEPHANLIIMPNH